MNQSIPAVWFRFFHLVILTNFYSSLPESNSQSVRIFALQSFCISYLLNYFGCILSFAAYRLLYVVGNSMEVTSVIMYVLKKKKKDLMLKMYFSSSFNCFCLFKLLKMMEIHPTKSSSMSWLHQNALFHEVRNVLSDTQNQICQCGRRFFFSSFELWKKGKERACLLTKLWLWISGLPVTLNGH